MVTFNDVNTRRNDIAEDDDSVDYRNAQVNQRYDVDDYSTTNEVEQTEDARESVTDAPQYIGESEYNDGNDLQEEPEYTIVKTFMPNVEKAKVEAPVVERKQRVVTHSTIKLNARGKIFAVMYGVIATLLIAFCIYNAVSLANMGNQLKIKQSQLQEANRQVNELTLQYNEATNIGENGIIGSGYEPISESNTVYTTISKRPNYVNVEASTNWFDSICKFLSNLFS